MAGGVVDAPPRGARIGMTPGRPCAPGADEIARLGGVFAGRVQCEGDATTLLLAIVERREIAAVAAVAREIRRRDAGVSHDPGNECTRPGLAGGAAVPVWMSAAPPVVADLAGERLAALTDAAAIGV